MTRAWSQVRSYVSSAPLTYAWLAVLAATTVVQHSLSERVLRALLLSTSTNLHHLAADPIRVLVNSLLWIDGRYWWPYLLIFTAFLAPVERWLGHLRWLLVGLVCHVGATLVSQAYLHWSIQEAQASPRLIDARDVGVSYFVVGIAGVLFYRLPRRWRWFYLGAILLAAVAGLAFRPNFTSVGHLCALVLGLACYPLTRGRRVPQAASIGAICPGDLVHLRRCVELAREGLDAGDEPFGSVLVGPDGATLFEDRNRVKEGPHGGDATRHPEFAIAQWAATNLAPPVRAAATVYTSGEHCPMCSAAHAWVGLGRIVYATSSAQLADWRTEWGATTSPVASLPISKVAPTLAVAGPAPELAGEMKMLYRAKFQS